MRKILFQILILIIFVGCSPKIKSITEYRKSDDQLLKSKIAEFNKDGYKTFERNFGNQRSNRIIKIEFKNGIKFKETDCDHFEKQDTCVVRQFAVFEYKPEENLKIQTMYEADSAIRLIRKYHKNGNLEVIKTNTWEMFPTKDPDPKNAMKLTDSVFYDSKEREIKRINHNEDFKEPWIEKYDYFKDGYSKEIIGTRMDTIRFYKYSKLDKIANKRKIDFNFGDTKNYKYEIEYY